MQRLQGPGVAGLSPCALVACCDAPGSKADPFSTELALRVPLVRVGRPSLARVWRTLASIPGLLPPSAPPCLPGLPTRPLPPFSRFFLFSKTVLSSQVLQVNGQKVVVKVQRPGLKELFDIDLKNVRVLAQFLQKVRRGPLGRCRRRLCRARAGGRAGGRPAIRDPAPWRARQRMRATGQHTGRAPRSPNRASPTHCPAPDTAHDPPPATRRAAGGPQERRRRARLGGDLRRVLAHPVRGD